MVKQEAFHFRLRVHLRRIHPADKRRVFSCVRSANEDCKTKVVVIGTPRWDGEASGGRATRKEGRVASRNLEEIGCVVG